MVLSNIDTREYSATSSSTTFLQSPGLWVPLLTSVPSCHYYNILFTDIFIVYYSIIGKLQEKYVLQIYIMSGELASDVYL